MVIRMPWTLGALSALSLALGVSGALASGGSGTRTHPIKLRDAGAVGDDWKLTVVSVTPHAAEALGTIESCGGAQGRCTVTRVTPPHGAEGYELRVFLHYVPWRK